MHARLVGFEIFLLPQPVVKRHLAVMSLMALRSCLGILLADRVVAILGVLLASMVVSVVAHLLVTDQAWGSTRQ
jgi:hypothetical protein